MKKNIIVLLFVVFAFSCNNDFELNENWKDIPVTYGIINPSDTAQYIRVERVFNDPEISGKVVAKNIDSIYYKNITVKLIREKYNFSYRLDLIDGNLDGHKRDTGAFANTPNYLYKIKTTDMDLIPGEKYKLVVLKENRDTLTYATTTTIKNIDIYRPSSTERPIKLDYKSKFTVSWDEDLSAGYYDMIITFNIKESTNNTDWVKKKYEWKVKTKLSESTNSILGESFYQFLQNKIPVIPQVKRKFVSFDVKIRAVGKELKDYTQVINANLGITSSQQIPIYTNLSNGYGIFTSINTSELNGFFLQEDYLDSLSYGIYTRELNFQ